MLKRTAVDGLSTLLTPHAGLRQCISFYNLVIPDAGSFSERYTLMPDANSTITVLFDGTHITSQLWGPSIGSSNIGNEPGHYQCLLLIELLPYGFYQLTGLPQWEFTAKRIGLSTVDPWLASLLQNSMESAETLSQLKLLVDQTLMSFIGNYLPSAELLLSVERLIHKHGNIPVSQLSHEVHYSQRHLNRIFLDQIGISVKTYARLVRFSHTLQQLSTGSLSFAELAQYNGYYDQSHFILDFKKLCGVTPNLFINNMSDFSYIEQQVPGYNNGINDRRN